MFHKTMTRTATLTSLFTLQVVTFMPTGVQVDDMDVVSIHLGEGLKLRHPASHITDAIQTFHWGKPSDSKDFLDISITVGSVITRQTGLRRRSAHIYLSKLPQELQDAIKNSW